VNLAFRNRTATLSVITLLVLAFTLVHPQLSSENSSAKNTQTFSPDPNREEGRKSIPRTRDIFSAEELRIRLNQQQNLTELIAYQSTIDSLLEKFPSHADDILTIYFKALGSLDRAIALRMLDRYLEHPYARILGTNIAKQWQLDDLIGFRSYLEQLVKDDEEPQARTILNHLFAFRNEKPDIVELVRTIDSEFTSVDALHGHALEAVVSQLYLGILDKDTELILLMEVYQRRFADEKFRPFVDRFVKQMAKDQPDQAREFLSELPAGADRTFLTESLLEEVSKTHPDVVGNWLSSEETLNKLISSSEDGRTWETRFDRLLSIYVKALALQYPDDALANLDSLIDPQFRVKFGAEIERIAEATKEKQGL